LRGISSRSFRNTAARILRPRCVFKVYGEVNSVRIVTVESSWNVMAHGDVREGKWRWNWQMDWVASTLCTTLEHGVSSIRVQLKCYDTVTHRRGNWRMQWVASTLHTTSEHGVSSITTADVHTSAASSWLNWHPHRFKWTSPSRRKTKSGFCVFTIAFQVQSKSQVNLLTSWHNCVIFFQSPVEVNFDRCSTVRRQDVWLQLVHGGISLCYRPTLARCVVMNYQLMTKSMKCTRKRS